MDYKETLNLPRTDFPMKADLPRREPEILKRWAEMDLYGRLQGPEPGRAPVHPARRPPLRQRPHPPGPRPEQDPQGHHRQVQADGGL